MALNAKKALAASKSYTDEVVIGGGAIKGKNCTVSSITDIPATSEKPAGQRVTFSWTLDDGTEQTGTMDVYNGEDGQDGQGIDRMYVNAEGHLVVVYDDGTEEDVGEITIPSFQADWNEADPSENSFIKNKPTLGTAAAKDSTNEITENSDDLVESGAVYTGLNTKADKVSSATNGNFAGLDNNGNLTDSGSKATDFLTQHQDISGKTDLTDIATVEGSTTASKAYAVDSYLIYSGTLYKVTTAISQGDTIVIEGAGANVTATKVMNEIGSGGGGGTSDYTDLSNKPSINSVTLSGNKTASDLGLATSNDLNTHVATKGDSGVQGHVSLYQGDVSNKAYAQGEAAASAHTHDTRYAPYSVVADISGKADKVQSATNGHLAGLDGGGNLTDSGVAASSVVTDVSGKADKVQSATNGNFAGLDANGNLTDSGKNVSDLDDKCDLTNIAKVFTTSDTFSVGDWVFYEGRLYKCTTLHQGAWNSSHFSANRVDQLIPDDMLSLYGRRSSISMSNTSPGKSSISAGGYSFSAFEFDTEYTVSGNEYALYNGLRYIDFDVIMGNDVYRNYKYYDASPYEAEYQSDNTPSYPFFFVVIDPEGYPFAIKMYDINLAAGTFKMKISYLNGYYRGAGEIYLAINSFERT